MYYEKAPAAATHWEITAKCAASFSFGCLDHVTPTLQLPSALPSFLTCFWFYGPELSRLSPLSTLVSAEAGSCFQQKYSDKPTVYMLPTDTVRDELVKIVERLTANETLDFSSLFLRRLTNVELIGESVFGSHSPEI